MGVFSVSYGGQVLVWKSVYDLEISIIYYSVNTISLLDMFATLNVIRVYPSSVASLT